MYLIATKDVFWSYQIDAYLDPVSVKLSPGCTNSILPGSETLCFSCHLFNDLSEPVLLTMYRVSPTAAFSF